MASWIFSSLPKADAPPPAKAAAPEEPKKPKPCCACPETKQARDKCIVENGEENCKDLIEAHRACMKQYGYNI